MTGEDRSQTGTSPNGQGQLEAHRAAIRKIEADIRKALAERDRLKPSGFFGMFGGGGDPAQLEEVEMTLQILRVELTDRRQQLQAALKAVEEAEHRARKAGLVSGDVPDAETAARMLHALKRLEQLLGDLQTMAGEAVRARARENRVSHRSHRTRSGFHHGDSGRTSRMAWAVRQSTEGWEQLLDEAEWMADIARVPLSLPRRYEGMPRPEHVPPEPPEMQLARKAERVMNDGEFGTAIELAQPRIQQMLLQLVYVREALLGQVPEAASIVLTSPFGKGARPVGGSAAGEDATEDATEVLIEEWEALRAIYTAIGEVAAKGGGTVAYLDPVGAWQRGASRVRDNPVAIQHGLLPPLNEGDLMGFVTRVQAEWPDLDTRFTQQVENRP